MTQGIYTLSNDNVYDQLVALLNSIEANYSKEIPVCVIPYDDNIEKVASEISSRKNTTLFSDKASIASWEGFASKVWQMHPEAKLMLEKEGKLGRHKLSVHRKLCCFNGPFEKFIFLDADTLVMNSLDFIFKQLDRSDFVVYDFQHKDVSHVYNVQAPNLYEIFEQRRTNLEIFCTGFFSSKRGLFDEGNRNTILTKLKEGQIDLLYPRAPEQSIMNYMVMSLKIPIYNFALHLPEGERTGNSVTSEHFQEKDNVLYDKNKSLTYLHYIGTPSTVFRQFCSGENIGFPYRDIFLHYRYLNEPDKRPVFKGKPKPYGQAPGLAQRIWRKFVA